MGLPEVEVSPVYFIKGLTLGQCCLPEGGQRHQRGTEEEGMKGGARGSSGSAHVPQGIVALILN